MPVRDNLRERAGLPIRVVPVLRLEPCVCLEIVGERQQRTKLYASTCHETLDQMPALSQTIRRAALKVKPLLLALFGSTTRRLLLCTLLFFCCPLLSLALPCACAAATHMLAANDRSAASL